MFPFVYLIYLFHILSEIHILNKKIWIYIIHISKYFCCYLNLIRRGKTLDFNRTIDDDVQNASSSKWSEHICAPTDIHDEFMFKCSSHNFCVTEFFGKLKTVFSTFIDKTSWASKYNTNLLPVKWNFSFYSSAFKSFFPISIIRSIFTKKDGTLHHFI